MTTMSYAPHIDEALRSKFEASDTCKNMRTNMEDHFRDDPSTWEVEHIRELGGRLEAWLFLIDPRQAPPDEHMHVTVHPNRSETVVHLRFHILGSNRFATQDYPHGAQSPN